MPATILSPFQTFAGRVTAAFSAMASVTAQSEAQLIAPTTELLNGFAHTQVLSEATLADIGRPDLGVLSHGLLTGHVELKAPGKGANPKRFTDSHDRKQWIKFQNLPNVLYTDGQEWALYRTGQLQGTLVRLSGDVTQDGLSAVTATNAGDLDCLLRDFLSWQPYVPTQPQPLAQILAPLCRLLRDDVTEALTVDPTSPLGRLHEEWKLYFFPNADAAQFADAYAQTLTYALLLAHVSGAVNLTPAVAAAALRQGHNLLASTLDILAQYAASEQIKVPLALLQRTIGAVQPALFNGVAGDADPWLYFYEDFLEAYDPDMRKKRGVYYTPIQVVQTQVRLVDELLRTRLNRPLGFVDENVSTIDPACGTGTYLLAALRHGLNHAANIYGDGARAHAATTAARNLYAFELLVGPYAVAHLRLTQQVIAAGGTLPAQGPNVLLADTLEAPHATIPSGLPLSYQRLGREHERAQAIKSSAPVLVCIGNPPYLREKHNSPIPLHERHGGWVRFGDRTPGAPPALLQDFIRPLRALGASRHAQNLYNDYVYFWRWSLWKILEQPSHHTGIVSFITGSSYLQGQGFAGMRRVMRETFEELWIIDLEGDNRSTRHTDNVFDIQTPVCIAVGLRTPTKLSGQPAAVHYCRLTGSAADKLARLGTIENFSSLTWQDCPTGFSDPLLPAATSAYIDWPKLTDIFPWQVNGMQFKRKWPIAESPDLLRERWHELLNAPSAQKGTLFKESRDRKIGGVYNNFSVPATQLPAITRLPANTPVPEPQLIAYRSFDRQWAIIDNRVGDYLRPEVQHVHGPNQLYLGSQLSKPLGTGPALVATERIPDLDFFCNRGGKDIIPLYRDLAGTQPNLSSGLLPLLIDTYEQPVSALDVFSYAYALLATPNYVELYRSELETPGPRVPFTRDAILFTQAAALGRRMLALHTGNTPPSGRARLVLGTPANANDYPSDHHFDEDSETLSLLSNQSSVCRITGVSSAVYHLHVSGLHVVKSWIGYRKRERAGRSSSPLDARRSSIWTFDIDLLHLLWTLEATLNFYPDADALREEIIIGPLFLSADLPIPTDAEHQGPTSSNMNAPGLFE